MTNGQTSKALNFHQIACVPSLYRTKLHLVTTRVHAWESSLTYGRAQKRGDIQCTPSLVTADLSMVIMMPWTLGSLHEMVMLESQDNFPFSPYYQTSLQDFSTNSMIHALKAWTSHLCLMIEAPSASTRCYHQIRLSAMHCPLQIFLRTLLFISIPNKIIQIIRIIPIIRIIQIILIIVLLFRYIPSYLLWSCNHHVNVGATSYFTTVLFWVTQNTREFNVSTATHSRRNCSTEVTDRILSSSVHLGEPRGFVLNPDSVWYYRVLLLFSTKVMTDTGSKKLDCAFVSTLETYEKSQGIQNFPKKNSQFSVTKKFIFLTENKENGV